jgi:L-seryl-tRNA(Ser) seleniumtransferase
MPDNPYRQLPKVSDLLELPALVEARLRHPHLAIVEAIRSELDQLRAVIQEKQATNGLAEPTALCARIIGRLDRAASPELRLVLNATGVVLHTNLGRSPMHELAAQAAYNAARGYLNLELSLETGKRNSRQNPVREGIKRITGAEAATVVNNCAAATVIVLRAMAAGKEVIVSRGQLVEVGGSFRIPEIMAVSGATLREVGSTNITRISDYEKAIGPNTGLLMRIHTSNFRVRGFTQAVGIEELVELGNKHGIPVVDDAGSGAVVDLAPYGLPGEPVVHEGIRLGADLVLFSGDKLLGGPQAGIIAGKKSQIDRIEKDPLMRAFRLDKMTLAALEATLLLYRDPARALAEVPTLRMLTAPLAELRERCQKFAERLRSIQTFESILVEDDVAFVGGGSLPDVSVPTVVIALSVRGMSEEVFAAKLRDGQPAVVARINDGHVRFDLRCIFPEQEDDLLNAIQKTLNS